MEAAQVPESWTRPLTQLEDGACDPWWLYALLGALGVAAVGFSGFVSWLLWMIFKGVFEPMTLPCYEIVWVRPDAWLAERAAPQVQTRLYGNLTAVQPAGGFVERFLQTSPTLLSLLPRCLVGERMALLRVLYVGRMGNRCFQYGFGRLRAAFLDLSFEAPPVDRPFDSLPARVRSRGLPLLLVPGSGWLRLPARLLFNFVEAFFIVWGTLLGLPRPTIPIGLPGESEGEHPGFAVRRGVPESAAWPVVEDDDASHDQAVLEGVHEDVPHPWLPLFDPAKADDDGGTANWVEGGADAVDGEDRGRRRRAGARPVSRSRSRSRSRSASRSRPREVEVRQRRGRSPSALRRGAVEESGLQAPHTLETSAVPVSPSSRSRASSEGGVGLGRAHEWTSSIAFPTHEFLPLTAAERAHWLSVPYSRYVQELAMLAGPRGVLLPMVRRWFLRSIEVAVQRRVAAQSSAVVSLEPDDVVMHVRLGDILTGWHAAYRPLPLSFYRAALQHFEVSVPPQAVRERRASIAGSVGIVRGCAGGVGGERRSAPARSLAPASCCAEPAQATGAPIRRVVLVGEHGDKYNILRTMAEKLEAERGCKVLLQSASAEVRVPWSSREGDEPREVAFESHHPP